MFDAQTLPNAPQTRSRLGWLRIHRTPLRRLGFKRLLVGGRLSDLGRLPRYLAIFLLAASGLWAPIVGYLTTAPLQYTSSASLILPGSGASASVNLSDIGQASSFANSAFSNGSVSPTETYKRLLGADRILDAAAKSLGVDRKSLGQPRITLVDQTSLMHIEVKSRSPETAQSYSDALLTAFFQEIDALRADEIDTRQASGTGAIKEYTASVQKTRSEISDLQARSGLLSADQYRDQVAAHDQRMQDLRVLQADVAQQDNKVRALETALGLPPNSAAVTLKLYADAQYLSLLEEVAIHAADLAQAKATYGAQHPIRLAAHDAHDNSQRAAIARAIEVTGLSEDHVRALDRAPEGQRATLLSELVRESATRTGLQQQYHAMSKQVADEDSRLRKLAVIAAELEDKQRDFAVAEAIFASAIARAESTKTDVYASYPLIQVLEDPSRPDSPSSPRRKLAIAAGIAATLMLLIGLTLAWVRQPIISRLIAPGKGRSE
ncbi:hypothetical protein MWU54_05605 [Marivita sp. S6314]|uniref:hypothetical protein n=1 Tax=Marivita sp. S6314 TaxID=2926406 RepID=UPI001FF4FEA8|nr:hypothetical protein [Marivita sp. S6314]MCK0149488.1 hypothetical protein [Marivita sp. S6314]